MRQDANTTVALVVVCQIAHFLTFAAIPLLLPAIREDLRINFAEAGMLAAAATLSYALAQIPAGYLSDRFGPRRLFFVGLMGWSVLCVSFGLIHAFWLALANQFVAGAFRALLFAPGLALLASWFPRRRATAMSLFLLGGAVGSIVLSLAGPALARLLGWRATLIIFAFAGIGAACLFAARAKEQPRTPGREPLAPHDLLRAARVPILWVCSSLQFIRFSVAMGFSFWLPSYLMADRGLSLSQTGLIMAMSAALSAPSNALGGYLSDRLRNPPLVIGAALGTLACAAALLPAVATIPLLLVVVAVYSVFLGAYFGPLFLVPVEVLGSRIAGTAIGFSNLFANIGGLSAVYVLGVIRDHSGSFAGGFRAIAGLCVAGVALTFVLARMRTRALGAAASRDRPLGFEL
ncbi:MAG: MFS transporter [Burkholderiales bacterium]|nr:MFS transporter [Burkholderiales bacterium]